MDYSTHNYILCTFYIAGYTTCKFFFHFAGYTNHNTKNKYIVDYTIHNTKNKYIVDYTIHNYILCTFYIADYTTYNIKLFLNTLRVIQPTIYLKKKIILQVIRVAVI